MSEDSPAARLLLVEGRDDKHVVIHLRGQHQQIPEFEVTEKESISKLVDSIPAELKVSGRIALGIMVDGNENPEARWDSITGILHSAGIDAPAAIDAAGTIIEGPPRVGIWLMPDNQSEGELEDFVSNLVPDEDPVWPRAKDYIDDIPTKDRKFKHKKRSRAILAAWLATREDPRQMGLAIKTQDLDANQPPALIFADWLRRTFD